MSQRDEKLSEEIRKLAAEYFSRESNRTSLITVTNVEILSHGSRARILMTVMPETQEAAVLDFTHRQLSDLKAYIHENSRIARLPFFEVGIDVGEKNRQRIEQIEKEL